MLHLIWYILVGLIAGVIAKSVMHVHMTIFWTIVLGIIGSIIGGAVTHIFAPQQTNAIILLASSSRRWVQFLLYLFAINCASISRACDGDFSGCRRFFPVPS
jgi:uncharacterized membrane protein YeaQ/YmgE (transglycosylase-associated protein family)